jgi:hypothetical protein
MISAFNNKCLLISQRRELDELREVTKRRCIFQLAGSEKSPSGMQRDIQLSNQTISLSTYSFAQNGDLAGESENEKCFPRNDHAGDDHNPNLDLGGQEIDASDFATLMVTFLTC